MDPASVPQRASSCATAAGCVTNACSTCRSHRADRTCTRRSRAVVRGDRVPHAEPARAAASTSPCVVLFGASPESRRPGRTVRTRPLRRARRARQRARPPRGGREAHLRALHVAEDQVRAARKQGENGGIRCVRRAPTRQPVQARQRAGSRPRARARSPPSATRHRGDGATAHCMRVAARARAREFSLTTLSQRVARVGRGGSVPGGRGGGARRAPRLSSAAAARLGSSAWSTRARARGARGLRRRGVGPHRRPRSPSAFSASAPPPRRAAGGSRDHLERLQAQPGRRVRRGPRAFRADVRGGLQRGGGFEQRRAPRALARARVQRLHVAERNRLRGISQPAEQRRRLQAPPPGATPVVRRGAAAQFIRGARGDAAGGDAGDGSGAMGSEHRHRG